MSFIAAGIATAGSLASGIIGANAASSAADKQAAAADRANETQYRIFQQQREDQEPWRKAGIGALSEMDSADFRRDFTAADFERDPGYDFRMQEGQKAIERSAAARGGLSSGGALKALTRYGQGFASNEYSNAYNRFNADRDRRFGRLSAIAGVGQTATNQVGQAGQNYAGNVGANTMGAANAAGAAGIAGANAIGGAIGGVGKTWMDYTAMNRANYGGGASGGAGGGMSLSRSRLNSGMYGG